jgi:V8-like Glu-specific endopeptidase
MFQQFDERLVDREELNSAAPIPLPVLEGKIPTGSEASQEDFHHFFALQANRGPWQPSTIPDGIEVSPEPPLNGQGPETGAVSHPMEFPPRAVGKLVGYRDGSKAFGTGWVVGPQHIMTAAHCAYRVGHGWIDGALFLPGHGAADSPIIKCLEVASAVGWSDGNPQCDPTDFIYDLAVFRADRPLAPVMGVLGWATSPGGSACTALGYPANPQQGLWRSTGRIAPQGDFIKMRNDLDPGCSGGPWVSWPQGQPIVLGINAFRLDDANVAYSPPLREVFMNLMEWVAQTSQ